MDLLLEATHVAEQRHFWFHGFRSFVAPLLDRAAAGRPGLRLLDCGCGTGANLKMLGAYGRAWGFDLTWTGLAFARRAGRTRIAQASVTHAPFADATFDVLTSFDVLYCLDERAERAALSEMYRLLKPGGHAIINVPAMSLLRGGHSVISREVRRYDRRGLRASLAQTGFRIEHLSYTNATLFPLILAVRVAQRARGVESPDKALLEIMVPPAAINGSLKALLSVEALLLRVVPMPFGSSLLCLARKPA